MKSATFSMPGVYDGDDLVRMKTAKKAVVEYLNNHLVQFLENNDKVVPDDIYIVWFCKTLQNWKALLSTDLVSYGIYFEATYNGDKNELYLDHYSKVVNVRIPIMRDHD